MRNLLILFLLLGLPAQAQTVSVKSGEHGAFTRLVLTYPAQVDWVLGRTQDGYGLRINGPDLPYDLSSVYRPITRDRLRAIWVDPATGDLLLGVDCPCHAIPFELGASILVIDIKDGAAPQNSSFELSLSDGAAMLPIQSAKTQRPRRMSRRDSRYDWLATGPVAKGQGITKTGPADTASAEIDAELKLENFRSLLRDEVGRSATQGVVEMQLPSILTEAAADNRPADDPAGRLPDNARAGVNGLPGIEISLDPAARSDLMVQGGSCPQAADLDVRSWSGSEDAATELALARASVLSEFDVPEPVQVTQAVDTHLHFGLGAEARLLLTSFLPPGRSDPLRTGMSYLVDGDSPPENPFRNMQSCDSATAFWALLAAPEGEAQSFINGPAVSRTFLALPASQRAVLGPETAKRLLASGDSANAEVVRQSFERAAPRDDPSVDLLSATQALQTGDAASAEAALPRDATGEAALARLLTLVEARFQQRKLVEGKDILALEAFAFEHGNGPLRPKLDRALSHATALGGDFAAAFTHAGELTVLEQDIWMLLAETGADSALLTFAVGIDPVRRAGLPLATRSKIAERLVAVGLPNAASDWAQSDDLDAGLAARVALANGDARTALRLLATRLPDVDPDLLAASYTAAGDFEAAASTYQTAGSTAEATRLYRWSGARDAPDGSPARSAPDSPAPHRPAPPPTHAPTHDSWATVASLLDPADGQNAARPLQAGQARLKQSAATRQAIANLLAIAPPP
ncbi:MAG: hypothetical protein ACK4GC_09460 [Paracoccaceae bacterium]